MKMQLEVPGGKTAHLHISQAALLKMEPWRGRDPCK